MVVDDPTFYVLDDQLVAQFEVRFMEGVARVECLLQNEQIVDYTIEYNGPVYLKQATIERSVSEMEKIVKNKLLL
ncbi:hypothetical protein LC087_09955 [Bacillus carboniphilus]|uniref:Uncharacterized protein n=1 Tax=Bacillus carboniphilus TaxID=86663 RepID=A0ABY9JPE8_9BACI|nr:hypothetical protein [Bacillus carboniphilus]WLR41261.1 hypothetical protein LC087_09955 [Bacillus carboniphilus]